MLRKHGLADWMVVSSGSEGAGETGRRGGRGDRGRGVKALEVERGEMLVGGGLQRELK